MDSSQSSSCGLRVRGSCPSAKDAGPPKEVAVLEGDDAQDKGMTGGPNSGASCDKNGGGNEGGRHEADAAGHPKFGKAKATGVLSDWSIPSVIDFGGDLDSYQYLPQAPMRM